MFLDAVPARPRGVGPDESGFRKAQDFARLKISRCSRLTQIRKAKSHSEYRVHRENYILSFINSLVSQL